jgi:YidC/Oxa1 family membrane protein insertase
MFDFLAGLLAFFYDVWPSYGGAIILFTLAIMLVLTPLSLKSTRSMIRMQRVQPELKRLQTQYKGDREALNREMMAFYQANNINPFSSCLPLLLQMPVFVILYRVLRGLTQKGADGNFDPKYLSADSALAHALRATDKMMSFGMDLSRGAMAELREDGLVKALPYFTLVALVALSAWYQQRQIQGRNPNAASINPQQQMITKAMPFIFIPITISIPAGLVIYFVTSNLVRIGQGALVTKLEFGDKAAPQIIVPPPSAPANPVRDASSSVRQSKRVTGPGEAQANANRNRRKKRK